MTKEIPMGWGNYKLQDLSLNKGEYGMNCSACEYSEGLKKYIRITDINERGNYIDNGAFVDDVDVDKFLLKQNDIVFARTGASVGKSYLYDEKDGELAYAGFLIKFSIDKTKCNPKILKYIFYSSDYDRWVKIMSARSGQPGINAEEYGSYKVCIPQNRKEQDKIVEVLDAWAKAVDLQEQKVEKLKEKKKALMQKLLKLGDEWPEKNLGQIIEYAVSGGTPLTTNEKYYGGNIVWVSIDDISKSNKYLTNSSRKLTNSGLDNSSAKLLPKNIILFAMYASIGKCVITKTECCTSQAILGIKVDDKNNTEFVYYSLASMQEKLAKQGQKGTQSNLNKDMVLKIKIKCPDLSMQNKIAKSLSVVDELIEKEDGLLCLYKKQQKSLMQKLLTGEIRV